MKSIPPHNQQDTCLNPDERVILSVDDAKRRIISTIQPLAIGEQIPLKQGLGRILNEAIYAPINVPPWNNSAMDGYAVRSKDFIDDKQHKLTVVGTAMAGSPFTGEVTAGQCVRIMTGGVIPRGCDTVIMQEQVTRDGNFVVIENSHNAGQHMRYAGEDIAAGQRILDSGKRITPANMGLLASLGIDYINVTCSPTVALFSTGDELRPVGEALEEGAIYDSNRYALHGLLQQIGIAPVESNIVRDNLESLQTALTQAAKQADVVITTGGVSVGDADYVRDVLAALGEVHLWRVGIKPGRPFAFGRIGRAWFFGLPGNPVSTMVTYYQFVLPALRRLMGETITPSLQFKVTCITELKKVPGRMEFQRGILEINDAGEAVVRSTGGQGSNILHSMSNANCFILLPADWGDVPAGTLVDVQPFATL